VQAAGIDAPGPVEHVQFSEGVNVKIYGLRNLEEDGG